MLQIKKGDNVIVTAGKDKGKKGKITRVLRDSDRLAVEGVNMAKRRIKPRRAGDKGQMVSVAVPLHRSNVMLFCAKCEKGSRFRSEVKKDKKVRLCVKCNKEI